MHGSKFKPILFHYNDRAITDARMDCAHFIMATDSQDEDFVLQMRVDSVITPRSCSGFKSGWGCGNFSVYDGK